MPLLTKKTSVLMKSSRYEQRYFLELVLEKNLFCYKEPFLSFAAKEFSEYYPESKFIHIVGNGFDVADSMCHSYVDALSDDVLSSKYLSKNNNSEIGFFKSIDGFDYPYWLKKK